ncbi:MAG: ATP-binding protein [Pseudomonadota bacterium]
MLKSELMELIANGESSGVEFKRDTVENFRLAQEIVAFANFMGGVILLGVDDDGSIAGISRPNLEEWVMELCRVKIDPPIIPYFEVVRNAEPEKEVAVVRLLPGPDKPYARIHDNRRAYFVRVGSTSREAGREELERMFQESGRLRYGQKPVPGSTLDDFDFGRLENYFNRVVKQKCPAWDDREGWERLLQNLEFAVETEGRSAATVDGLLLFGRNPKRFLPQSGLRAIAYPGTEPGYAVISDQDMTGPITPLFGPRKTLLEAGLIDQALDFIARHTQIESRIVRGRRIDKPAYPEAALREAIVNAIAHRDYSVAGAEIQINLFEDRLEIISPGRLPNSATVESIKTGFRYARNQVLVNVLRDYGYVDARGMGIRFKLIPEMRKHNKTEPELVATEHNLTVRLWCGNRE